MIEFFGILALSLFFIPMYFVIILFAIKYSPGSLFTWNYEVYKEEYLKNSRNYVSLESIITVLRQYMKMWKKYGRWACLPMLLFPEIMWIISVVHPAEENLTLTLNILGHIFCTISVVVGYIVGLRIETQYAKKREKLACTLFKKREEVKKIIKFPELVITKKNDKPFISYKSFLKTLKKYNLETNLEKKELMLIKILNTGVLVLSSLDSSPKYIVKVNGATLTAPEAQKVVNELLMPSV